MSGMGLPLRDGADGAVGESARSHAEGLVESTRWFSHAIAAASSVSCARENRPSRRARKPSSTVVGTRVIASASRRWWQCLRSAGLGEGGGEDSRCDHRAASAGALGAGGGLIVLPGAPGAGHGWRSASTVPNSTKSARSSWISRSRSATTAGSTRRGVIRPAAPGLTAAASPCPTDVEIAWLRLAPADTAEDREQTDPVPPAERAKLTGAGRGT